MLFFDLAAPTLAAEQGYYVYADWGLFSLRNAPEEGADAIRLGGGYHINRYAGIETGIFLISPFLSEERPQISTSDSSSRSMSVTTYHVAVIGSLPLSQRNELFGKLGWASTTLGYSYSSGNATGSGNATKSNPLFGFGWQYTPGKNSSFRLQYENFGRVKLTTYYNNPYSQSSTTTDIGVQAISVGIGYNF